MTTFIPTVYPAYAPFGISPAATAGVLNSAPAGDFTFVPTDNTAPEPACSYPLRVSIATTNNIYQRQVLRTLQTVESRIRHGLRHRTIRLPG